MDGKRNVFFCLGGLLVAVLVMVGCRSIPKGVYPVTDFDLQQYLGTWHEVARFDFAFERNLRNVTAEYSMNEDGSVKGVKATKGADTVIITLGERGCVYNDGDETVFAPAVKSEAVDTTGAGDSFWGGVLTCLTESGKRPDELTLAEAAGYARFGNAVAALCVRKRGAIPAMPAREAVLELLK